jgi:hypothetical protein
MRRVLCEKMKRDINDTSLSIILIILFVLAAGLKILLYSIYKINCDYIIDAIYSIWGIMITLFYIIAVPQKKIGKKIYALIICALTFLFISNIYKIFFKT